MLSELNKRIITSLLLVLILILMFFYNFILISCLILIGVICWIEFYGLISKIFNNNDFKEKLIRFILRSLSLFYFSLLIFFILFIKTEKPDLEKFIIYSLFVSIASDIGGFLFGKVFKGKKLTKISPNKTISGSIGSFIFSILLIPVFVFFYNSQNFLSLTIITILISLISQCGDIFISFLKRKAKVKDTSNLLPGHGGFLDRLDGVVFAIPFGILFFNFI